MQFAINYISKNYILKKYKYFFLSLFLFFCACQFSNQTEKVKSGKKDTLSMAEQLKLLNEEISAIDSLWIMEMKKNTEKDTALLKRLDEIRALRIDLDEATRAKNLEQQANVSIIIQAKITQNKMKTENKFLRDTLDFLREKSQILEKELKTKNPESYQNNIIVEQHYQKMLKQNQNLQQEIAKLRGVAYLTKFDIRACQGNGKTAKYARGVDYFEVNFEFKQSEKPAQITDHRIGYRAFKDGKEIVFRKIDNASKITLTSEKFKKGRYDILMLLDGKEVGKTAIDLNKFL